MDTIYTIKKHISNLNLDRRKKVQIMAVYDSDIQDILTTLNLLDDLNKDKILCEKCKKILTIETIGSIKIINNKTLIYCSDINCQEKD